jgi:hypothetical protein
MRYELPSKTFRILPLILAFSAGPSLASGAAETYVAYNLRADFTNVEAEIWDVHGAPRTVPSAFPAITPSVTVQTDGSGKISGTGSLEILYDSTSFPFSTFVIDIAGKIASSTAKPAPVVTMILKGSGYTVDANGVTTLASASLKFKGEPGPDPSNTNRTRIVGLLNGTIHGATPLGARSAKLVDVVAYINNSSSDTASLRLDIVQGAKSMLILDTDWSGHGSINTRSNTFKLSAHGAHASKGTSLVLSGAMALYTNSIGTNDIPFNAPVSLTGKGKISGQAISGTADNVRANLIQP